MTTRAPIDLCVHCGEPEHRGNLASESGDNEKAERHYERAQKWHDRMNELLEVVNEEEGAKSR